MLEPKMLSRPEIFQYFFLQNYENGKLETPLDFVDILLVDETFVFLACMSYNNEIYHPTLLANT
jgi:hypothetical protein